MKKWIGRAFLACVAVATLVASSLFVLRWLHPEPAVQGRPLSAWLADLRSAKPAVRQAAAEAISTMGPQAIPFLSDQLTRSPNPIQKAAQQASKHVPNSLKHVLLRIYTPRDQMVEKHTALTALSLMGTNAAGAIPALAQVLRGPNPGLSSTAAAALYKTGPDSVAVLIAALDDPDFNIRANACYALGLMRSDAAPAVSRLARIIQEERGRIVDASAVTLGKIGEPAVPALIEFLSSTNRFIRRTGANSLMAVNPPATAALPRLTELSQDPDPGVRAAAVAAVLSIDRTSPERTSVLLAALDDPSEDIRVLGAKNAMLRPRFVIEWRELFQKLLDDESMEVRSAAALAIGQTGTHGQWAVPILTGWLNSTSTVTSQNVLRASASAALNFITNSGTITQVPRRSHLEIRDQ